MELFFPKIYKISLIEGPFSEFISINRKGLPNTKNLIFFIFNKIFNLILPLIFNFPITLSFSIIESQNQLIIL